MSLDDWHLVVIAVCGVLVFAAFSPIVAAYLPNRVEPFFALAVLGADGKAERYYPNDDANLRVGDEVKWIVYLYNHMGEAQYVSVRFKLLNSTMLPPDFSSNSPSQAPSFFEIRRILMDNETLLYPLSWSIDETQVFGDTVKVTRLSVNDNLVDADILAKNGHNFRIVIELWTYDEDLKDFVFEWNSGDEMRSAWNQLWFNSTLTSS